MSMLRDAMQTGLGPDVRFIEDLQYPGHNVLRRPAGEVLVRARTMKKVYACLPRVATDETVFGRASGYSRASDGAEST